MAPVGCGVRPDRVVVGGLILELSSIHRWDGAPRASSRGGSASPCKESHRMRRGKVPVPSLAPGSGFIELQGRSGDTGSLSAKKDRGCSLWVGMSMLRCRQDDKLEG